MKINLEQKFKFYKMLTFYSNSNLDIITALELIESEMKKLNIKLIIEKLLLGEDLKYVLEKYKLTDEFITANLAVGDNLGNYKKIYEIISAYLYEKQRNIYSLKKILIYPFILILMMIVLIVFIITFAVPQLYEVYTNMGAAPPTLMENIIKIKYFLFQNSIEIRWILFTVILLLIMNPKKTLIKKKLQHIILKCKWINKIYVNYHIKDISWQIYNLMNSGVDIVQAFKIVRDNSKSIDMANKINEVLEYLKNGGKLSMFCESNSILLGRIIYTYIKIGEETGNISENIEHIYNYTNEKFNDAVDIINKLLPPILILIIGIFMGILLMIIIPLLDASNLYSAMK